MASSSKRSNLLPLVALTAATATTCLAYLYLQNNKQQKQEQEQKQKQSSKKGQNTADENHKQNDTQEIFRNEDEEVGEGTPILAKVSTCEDSGSDASASLEDAADDHHKESTAAVAAAVPEEKPAGDQKEATDERQLPSAVVNSTALATFPKNDTVEPTADKSSTETPHESQPKEAANSKSPTKSVETATATNNPTVATVTNNTVEINSSVPKQVEPTADVPTTMDTTNTMVDEKEKVLADDETVEVALESTKEPTLRENMEKNGNANPEIATNESINDKQETTQDEVPAVADSQSSPTMEDSVAADKADELEHKVNATSPDNTETGAETPSSTTTVEATTPATTTTPLDETPQQQQDTVDVEEKKVESLEESKVEVVEESDLWEFLQREMKLSRKCAACSAEEGTKKLKPCAKCRQVLYCCKDCQKKHWKLHKKVCCK